LPKNIHIDLVQQKKAYGYFITSRGNQTNSCVSRIIDETTTIEDNIIKEQNLKNNLLLI
jgi:hypothetical protein